MSTDTPTPERVTCPSCGANDGNHGLVHVRHGNGGGSNRPCPERVTLTAEEREALARHLYDVEGFHAADSWATETPIARGRYEALAEAVDGSRWLAGVLAAREQALREKIAEEIEDLPDVDGPWDLISRGHAARIARGGAR